MYTSYGGASYQIIMTNTRRLHPKGGTFFRLQVFKGRNFASCGIQCMPLSYLKGPISKVYYGYVISFISTT